MKLKMIIGKKQLVLASLVLVLGVAVYLNWQFAQIDTGLPVTNQLEQSEQKNLGEAELVNANSSDFFAQTKLERDKARSESVETLATMLKDSELSASEKANATAQAVKTAGLSDIEAKMESLIKAKGFADCVVYYDGEKVDVVVKCEDMVASQAAQIKDIVVDQTKITADKIKIVPTK